MKNGICIAITRQKTIGNSEKRAKKLWKKKAFHEETAKTVRNKVKCWELKIPYRKFDARSDSISKISIS